MKERILQAVYRRLTRWEWAMQRRRCPFCHNFAACVPGCVGDEEFLPRLSRAMMDAPTKERP